jgi:hypothetical protein
VGGAPLVTGVIATGEWRLPVDTALASGPTENVPMGNLVSVSVTWTRALSSRLRAHSLVKGVISVCD